MFCRVFMLYEVRAVDAVATLPTFTYRLLIAARIFFCRNDADAPGKQLHPPLKGRWPSRASYELDTDSVRQWNSC